MDGPDLLSGEAVKPPPAGLRIIEFAAENVKRIEVIEIRPDGDIVELTGKNGQGKQQPVSEPVLTPGGWRLMGDLRPGDWVIGSNGRRTEVLAVFPQTDRRTFSVRMADGAMTRCGPDHLWTVRSWKSVGGESCRVIETLTTSDLMNQGLRNGLARKWALPLVCAVTFEDLGQEMPINPYALGVVLGDGHIEPTGYVTIDSDEAILNTLPSGGWRGGREWGSGFWSRPLRHLGLAGKLSHEKFIPEMYQRASIADRTALFLGLMDTDGTPEKAWASYCTTSEQLADDFVSLASSLGHVCKKRQGATKKYRYEGELKEGRMAWNIGVKSAEVPFSLARKATRWSTSVLRPEPRRFIDTIEQVEDESSVCIQVAATDGLYVTKDFILTHNTSVLDALWWAFDGTRNIQSEPIRRGAQDAQIKIDLGDFVVRRVFRNGEAGVTTSLSVTSREGAEYRRPQALVDQFFNALSLDPLAFLRMDTKAQFALVRPFVAGVDFEAIEAANKTDYATRRDLNAEAKQQRSLVAKFTAADEDQLPEHPIDLDAIGREMETAGKFNGEISVRIARREAVRDSIETQNLRMQELATQANGLRRQLNEVEAEADRIREGIAASEARLAEAPPLPEPVIVGDILARLNQARGINGRIDVLRQRDEALAAAIRAETAAKKLTEAMDARLREADTQIAAAEIPVEGLSLTPAGGVMLDGFPFDQASDAGRLRASIGLAMALNPRLKVLRVRDGSLLDEDGMATLAAMAKERGYQVWIERISTGADSGFVMVEGRIKSTPASRRGTP